MTPNLRLDKTLLALAHPARRAILQRLSKGEARVTALVITRSLSENATHSASLNAEKF
jgi:DNA-binding transcriptional ArsR family regulator